MPALVLMTDRARLADPAPLLAALPAGSAVIVRDLDPARAAAEVQRLQALPAASALIVMIALAHPPRRALADGYHIPERSLRHWRRTDLARLRPLTVTASAHGLAGLRAAARLGASAALLSPVFPTLSHPGARTLGPYRFAALVRAAAVPVIALGGIHSGNARRLRGLGAAGIAGIGVFTSAGIGVFTNAGSSKRRGGLKAGSRI